MCRKWIHLDRRPHHRDRDQLRTDPVEDPVLSERCKNEVRIYMMVSTIINITEFNLFEWKMIFFARASVCLYVCLYVCVSVCFGVCLSVCLGVCLAFCLCMCLFVCLSVCLLSRIDCHPEITDAAILWRLCCFCLQS